MVDNLVDKMAELRENIRVSKFQIQHVADPPQAPIDCYLGNYYSYKKGKKQSI